VAVRLVLSCSGVLTRIKELSPLASACSKWLRRFRASTFEKMVAEMVARIPKGGNSPLISL